MWIEPDIDVISTVASVGFVQKRKEVRYTLASLVLFNSFPQKQTYRVKYIHMDLLIQENSP